MIDDFAVTLNTFCFLKAKWVVVVIMCHLNNLLLYVVILKLQFTFVLKSISILDMKHENFVVLLFFFLWKKVTLVSVSQRQRKPT